MKTLENMLLLILLLSVVAESQGSLDHYKHEGHNIMKRMAEGGQPFEGHDVARVHMVDGLGQRGRRLVKRDLKQTLGEKPGTGTKSRVIHVALDSGSTVNLTLTPARIVDRDTRLAYHTSEGRVEGHPNDLDRHMDCYSHGDVEDSSGKGWAAISHCDGVFGFASSENYEYYLHPVESKRRSKRGAETNSDSQFDVHVMWREKDSQNLGEALDKISETDHDIKVPKKNSIPRFLKGSDADRINATAFVVELAMFTDQQFWTRLHYYYPGRENDFLFTRLAGTQSLYSNREKVGYDVQIKLKYMEYWLKNPKGYKFTTTLGKNLKSFCHYTTKKHFYDVHALNTGVWKWNKGKVGLAYLKGACSKKRCFVSKGIDLKTFVLYAHELGHTLGMPHQGKARCPKELKKMAGGFMGGGKRYNFSPCMKYMLAKFLDTRRSNCLFKESGFNSIPKSRFISGSSTGSAPLSIRTDSGEELEPLELMNVFPGQNKDPDGLCYILAGKGYKYVPSAKSLGFAVCKWLVCLNEDDSSPEFGRARRFNAPDGFPCAKDSFCMKDKTCLRWKDVTMVIDYRSFENLTQIPTWSEWSREYSECSRTCGTGVRTRRRTCQFPGLNMSPYCPGVAVMAELCNTEPCRKDPVQIAGLRQVRGNEVCARFRRNKVQLKLKAAKGYQPKSAAVRFRDGGARLTVTHSPSCMIKCMRVPSRVRGELDAFMPDGTPCYDSKKSKELRRSLNITPRCVRGRCVEFTSGCPVGGHVKDACGVCGGDGSRCVKLTFDSSHDVPKGQRSHFVSIPQGSTNIEVTMDRKKNAGVILELWSSDNQCVIGKWGRFPGTVYKDDKAVDLAGTTWNYKRNAFIRAPGPTQETIAIKAFRRKNPITEINIKFTRGNVEHMEIDEDFL